MSLQDVNVILDGLTVATAGEEDLTSNSTVVLPVRLHPFLPSPLTGFTNNVVVPTLPTFSGMISAVASMVASRLL